MISTDPAGVLVLLGHAPPADVMFERRADVSSPSSSSFRQLLTCICLPDDRLVLTSAPALACGTLGRVRVAVHMLPPARTGKKGLDASRRILLYLTTKRRNSGHFHQVCLASPPQPRETSSACGRAGFRKSRPWSEMARELFFHLCLQLNASDFQFPIRHSELLIQCGHS